jgi:exodeoxyribonuclease-1
LALLKQHPEVRNKLLEMFSVKREYANSDNVDTMLYDGFFSTADRSTMDIIRETEVDSLATLEINVEDERIKPLLFRYRARNYPLTLTYQEQQRWKHHCQDFFEQNMTKYMENFEAAALDCQSDENKMKIMKSLYDYINKLM